MYTRGVRKRLRSVRIRPRRRVRPGLVRALAVVSVALAVTVVVTSVRQLDGERPMTHRRVADGLVKSMGFTNAVADCVARRVVPIYDDAALRTLSHRGIDALPAGLVGPAKLQALYCGLKGRIGP